MEFQIPQAKGLNYILDTLPGSDNIFTNYFKELRLLPLYPNSYGHFIAGKNHYTRRSGVFQMCQIFYTISGEGIFLLQGKKYIVGPDTVVLLSGAYPHVYKANNCVWDHEFINFSGIACDVYYELINPDGFTVFSLNGNSAIPEYIHKIRDCINSQDATEMIHSSTHLINLIDLLYSLSNDQKKKEQTAEIQSNINRAIIYIDEHYMQKISLDDLSNIAILSKYYFCRLFKECIGYTPHEYLINVRIKKAKQLLLSTNMSIDEIAFKTGFSDSTNFVHLFKSTTGTTPGKYRNNIGFI